LPRYKATFKVLRGTKCYSYLDSNWNPAMTILQSYRISNE